MGCNTLVEPACRMVGHLIQSGANTAAGGALDAIAQAVSDGIRWVVVNTATWWLQILSPDLASEPAVTRIQQWLLPITAAVAAGGVIAAGARMALTRRANPLIDVTGGLLTLATATTLGVTVTTVLLKAGDAWSAWILQESTGGHFTQRLELVLGLGGAASAVVVIFGVIAILLSLVQAILMLFRQAALVVLAGVLPLAAAGAVAPMTRPWVRKVAAWMLALICYKPAAAAVYAAAFTMVGSGRGARTTLMGFVLLLFSVLTLPALMRFFTWTTGAIGAPSGGGQLLGAATVGALALGALRSGGPGTAQDQAHHIDSALGPPTGGGAAGGPGSVPPDGAGPSGPPPSGQSPSGPASAGAGPGGSGPGAIPGTAPNSGSRRPPPWPGSASLGKATAGVGAWGGTADGGAVTTGADTSMGSSSGGPGAGSGASSPGYVSTHGAGTASGATAGAASGAGAAAAVAAEAARAAAGGARLASGAMSEEEQR